MLFRSRPGLALVACAAILGSHTAQAQDYYDDGYGNPPPRRGYYEERVVRRPPPPRYATGLNCDALQPGIGGPRPYSCPLPGPRPLGVRCFCDTPIAPFSGPNTVVGHVVP